MIRHLRPIAPLIATFQAAILFLFPFAQDALAQSASDPNEGSRMQYDPTSNTATFSWFGHNGMGYFIQETDDLMSGNWQYIPTLEVGSDAPLSYGFNVSSPSFFLRLQKDAQPFLDSGASGLPNGYQILSGIAPNSGGLTYLQLWLLQHMPGANAHPVRLPNGTNVYTPLQGDTPNPGADGTGPTLDPDHDANNNPPEPPEIEDITANVDGSGNTDPATAYISYWAGDNAQSVILQRRDSDGAWTTIATLDVNGTDYEDGPLLANVDHLYRLVATEESGAKLQSNTMDYTVPLINTYSIQTSSQNFQNQGFQQPGYPGIYYTTHTVGESESNEYGSSSYSMTAVVDPGTGVTTYSGTIKQNYSYPDGTTIDDYETLDSEGNWSGSAGTWEDDPNFGDRTDSYLDQIDPNDFLEEVSGLMPPYGSWQKKNYWQDCAPNQQVQTASRTVDAAGDQVDVTQAQYQFNFDDSAPGTVTFYQLFTPEANDPSNPPPAQVIDHDTVTVPTSTGSSQTFEANPWQTPDALLVGSLSGTYSVIQGAQMIVSASIPDPGAPGGVDNTNQLDSSEKSGGTAILKAGTEEDDPVSATISLSIPPDVPGATYTLTWDNPNEFQVIDNATMEVIQSGTTFDYSDLDTFDGLPTFTVYATSLAGDGQQFQMTLTAEDAQGKSLGTDSVTFTAQNPVTVTYTLPFSEASGPRYRKVALNGRPLTDEKPQEKAETDEEKVETYVDALDLKLHHSEVDLCVPLPGSDMTLSVRREALSEVWNMCSGLRPHERLDRPFGAAWTSNLCPNLEVIYDSLGNEQQDIITDQNGLQHVFMPVNAADGSPLGYIPVPGDARENSDYEATFYSGIFTDRFGTAIYFGEPIIGETVADDRNEQSSTELHEFYGVAFLQDRCQNTLVYQYPDNAVTLVPSVIYLQSDPTQCISIEQDTNGHVTHIWDANGSRFDYSYTQQPAYSFGTETYAETGLTKVTYPDTHYTQYTYDFATETDLTPVDITNGQPADKLHLDLKTITDPRQNTTQFSYVFDQSKLDYNSTDGYYIETGAARRVSQVALPGVVKNTVFTSVSPYRVAFGFDTNGNPTLIGYDANGNVIDGTTRVNQVTDALGKLITYTFSDAHVFNVFSPGTPVTEVPKVVFFDEMDVMYGTPNTNTYYGVESFRFNPSAGLALSQTTDLSGSVTQFAYDNPIANATIYGSAYPYPGFAGMDSEPTSQTNDAGFSKTFTYGTHHIMNSVEDEDQRVRTYDLDVYGNRLNEKIYTLGTNSPLVQETDYEYANATFPGVVTKQTVKDLDQFGWTQDLVTENTPDPTHGWIIQQTVNPGGLNLNTYFTYDADGNRISVTDPKQYTTWFEYDGLNRKTMEIYPDGNATIYGYDEDGNKISEEDENQHFTYYGYDQLDRLTSVTRPLQSGDILTQYAYNDVNSKTSITDPRTKITYLYYDDLQRLTKVTDPRTFSTYYYYDGPYSGGSAFDSSSFKPTSVVDPRGYTTTNTYDDLHRLFTKVQQYNLAPNAASATTTYVYDNVGNAISVTDDRLHKTTTDYDSLNRPYHVTYADTHDTWAYYTATGLKYAVQDEMQNVTNMQYDGAGRLTAVIAPPVDDGEDLSDTIRTSHMKNPTTSTTYDDNGNVATVQDPMQNVVTYHYDVRNRKIEEDQPAVDDATTGATTQPIFYYGYDYVGNLVWVQDPRGYTMQTAYDEANRPTGTTLPPVFVFGVATPVVASTSKTYDPNGNVLTATDANGNTTINTYDEVNHLATSTDAQGNEVQYFYDEVGNRSQVEDGNLNSTYFSYDGMNRMTTIQDATGVTDTTFTYDGVVKTGRTDSLGQATSYGYDVRNRLTSAQYAGRTVDNRGYSYNNRGDLTGVTEPGKNGVADVVYNYDATRRPISEASNGATHTYWYDLNGNRTTTQYGYPSGDPGRLLTSGYDALNRLTSLNDVQSGTNSLTTQYGYDLNGNLVAKLLPNGEIVSMSYDGLNRQFIESDNAPTGLLYNYLSLCDPGGNLHFSSDTTVGVPPRILMLGYDLADRLTSETVYDGSGNQETQTLYTYDPASNRSTKTVTPAGGNAVVTTYTYNPLNQLGNWSDTNGNSASYGYDTNGNRTSRTVGTLSDSYSYDYENRLVSLTKNTTDGSGAGTYSYVYDYRTRRTQRTENTVPTSVVFSGGTSVQEYQGTTVPSVEYVRGSDWGGGVGGILYSVRGGTESFAHYDRRGDVTTHTDASGVITYQASYEAGGTRTAEYGSTQDRQKANTKEEDPTGLLDEGMRYRDLETDMFITRDPAGFVDGPNLYCYVRQNPWTAFDPEGLATEDERKQEAEDAAKQAEPLEKKAKEEEAKARENYWGNLNDYKPAQAARDAADDMKHRAYILAHGTEQNYRKMVIDQYGINNSNLNEIMAYYADQFNDCDTLAFLAKQHPAPPLGINDLNNIALALILAKVLFPPPQMSSVLGGDKGQMLYRGVPGNGTQKAILGQQGIAKPLGTAIDQASLIKHVLGEDVKAGVTSWTPDRAVARRFSGPNGTIIEVPAKNVSDKIVPRPDVGKYSGESEVLLKGTIQGTPTRP